MSPAKKPDEAGDEGRALREAAPYLGIGASLAATMLLCVGAGYWADRSFGTDPWFLLAGMGLGIVTSLYQFFRTVSRK
jgi:F0F1-type ATP synthase assembly protein I